MSAQYAPWILAAPVRFVGRCLYRLTTLGAERLPEGGALLVANHLSYADVLVLQMACPRPIRFVGHEGLLKASWFFRWVFRLTGTIAPSSFCTFPARACRRSVPAVESPAWETCL